MINGKIFNTNLGIYYSNCLFFVFRKFIVFIVKKDTRNSKPRVLI